MILNTSACYLNVYPEKKWQLTFLCIALKGQTKIFDHPNCSFQSPYKFEKGNKMFRGLMFILVLIQCFCSV